MSVSPQKSAVMVFTRRRIPHLPQIHLEGTLIPYIIIHCFPGLIFDGSNLTWKDHIIHLCNSCQNRLNIMRSIASHKWGANRETLLHFYKTYIKSKIAYGSLVHGSASNSTLQKLDIIHHAAIRIAVGAFCSSPITSILAEAGIMPLKYSRSESECRWLQTVLILPPSHPLSTILRSSGVPFTHPSWPRCTRPFLVRALQSSSNLGLQSPTTLSHISCFPYPSLGGPIYPSSSRRR